jgi:hypothetical protein
MKKTLMKPVQIIIPGMDNWSNGLTKPETAEQLNAEAKIYQVQVTP